MYATKTILTSDQRGKIFDLCISIARNQGAGMPVDVVLAAVEEEYNKAISKAEQGEYYLNKYAARGGDL